MSKNAKDLKMMYLNIRSLYKHKDELFLNYCGYDVIAIGETWLNQRIPNQCIMHQDYNLFRADRDQGITSKKRGGGLVTYVHISLGRYANVVKENTSINKDLEQLWVDISVPNHKRTMVINVYRPPDGNIQEAFCCLKTNLDNWVDRTKYDIVIMGDLNVNLKGPKSNGVDMIYDLCRDFYLYQKVDSPTRITSAGSSLIDIILTNMDNISNVGVHNIVISDHLPVYIIKKKHRIKREYAKVKGRPMKKYDKEHFQSLVLNDHRWDKFWYVESVKEKWEIMLQIMIVSLNTVLPLKTMRIPKNSPAWLTPEIIDMIDMKNKLFKLAKIDNTRWKTYRNQKHLVNRTIKREKRNKVQKTLDDNRNNPKEFWMEIQNLLGTSSMSSEAIKTIRDAGGNLLNDKEAADYMNDYYAHIGENLANLIPDISWNPHNNFMTVDNQGLIFRIITEKETRALVKGIDTTKSSAMDGIKSKGCI